MAKSFKIKRTTNTSLIKELDSQCFDYTEDDPVVVENNTWWIITSDGVPIAYAGAKHVETENVVYLSRVGVLEDFRGNGLQVRLIRARVRWAKEIGAEQVITYTVAHNIPSCNSLIKEDFLMYRPEYKWGGTSAVYWVKKLSKE